jgi:two-component system, OmpR family, sensor histidine kinase VicK
MTSSDTGGESGALLPTENYDAGTEAADSSASDHEEKTEVIYGEKNVINCALQLLSTVTKTLDLCGDRHGPSIIVANKQITQKYIELHERGVRQRQITEITKENIIHCKKLMKFQELRHLDGLKGYLSIADGRVLSSHAFGVEGKTLPHAVTTTVRIFVEQQQYFFETLWNKAIPAEHRIREIEEEIEPQGIAVIYDARQALELYQSLIMTAEKEIKVVFPTTNALIRQDKAGILFLLQEAATAKKCQVKVLMPNDELICNFIHNNSSGISTRLIDQEESGKATILIVDNKTSLVMELKDDSKKAFHEAIGLSTYSNSKAGVLSYVSMFESLWKQTQLYEKLKGTEKMQKEFINIAAHELRTPIVPILNLSEILYSNAEGQQRQVQEEEQKEMLEVILRNANRLHQLTEDILDVTRIESDTLQIRKERLNLNDVILSIVEDYRKQIANGNGNVKVMYESTHSSSSTTRVDSGSSITLVEADRLRLAQVIANLLDNAIKFTKEGTVSVTTSIRRKGIDRDSGEGGAEVVIAVKDTGTGIDPELMPRLFTKFATKSFQGTGLGLYISKSIIEAHGGRMWAENSKDHSNGKQKGAIFYFTLPVVDMNEQKGEEENEAKLVNDQLQ